MDSPTPPPAPDPVKTAQAQTASNKETAVAQYGLNATNQVTPSGSLSYNQVGTWADGTPRFEATTALSPQQQSLYDKTNVTQSNLADIGNQQSARIGQQLNTPFQYNLPTAATNVAPGKIYGADDFSADRTKVEDALYSRINPQLDRDTAALQTQLINKGLRPGTEAWTQAIDADNRARTDARMQVIGAGGAEQSRLAGLGNTAENIRFGEGLTNANLTNSQRAALAQQQLTERNQPINEISALLSGSQVSNPNFVNAPTPGVAPTDVIGAQQQALNQQNVGYQGNLAQTQAFNSGLFGLGGAALGAGGTALGGWMRSDINSKENIEVVGERGDGLHVIDFDYKPEFGGGKDNRGLIAQEVAQVYPHAVARDRRGLMVDYSKVPAKKGMFALGSAA
jgi:hypothetical protein